MGGHRNREQTRRHRRLLKQILVSASPFTTSDVGFNSGLGSASESVETGDGLLEKPLSPE